MIKNINISWFRLFLYWSHDFITKESICINKKIHGKNVFISWKEPINWASIKSLIMLIKKMNMITYTLYKIRAHSSMTIRYSSKNNLTLHSSAKKISELSVWRMILGK